MSDRMTQDTTPQMKKIHSEVHGGAKPFNVNPFPLASGSPKFGMNYNENNNFSHNNTPQFSKDRAGVMAHRNMVKSNSFLDYYMKDEEQTPLNDLSHEFVRKMKNVTESP